MSPGEAAGFFSSTYSQARSRFLGAAASAGLAVDSRVHPGKGREGETLAMDVVRDGAPEAKRLLILTSACHGVEGFCGSGVQAWALQDAAWRAHAARNGVAVVYVHALNPYGFSHLRRTTHENIDLNRNFHDFSQPLPVNEAYRTLHASLLPQEWPPGPQAEAGVHAFLAANGIDGLQAAITRGQHEFPGGMFFGGTQPSWSNTVLRDVLRSHGSSASSIAWIDFHTGLGESGVGERIFAGRDDAAAVTRARQWWGGNGATPVTSIYDGSSTSAFLTGLMFKAIYEECPHAQYTGIALEYGTLPLIETLQSVRAEQWLHLHPEAPNELGAAIKQRLLDAFYTDTDAWKHAVLTQAQQALFQAADGLATS